MNGDGCHIKQTRAYLMALTCTAAWRAWACTSNALLRFIARAVAIDMCGAMMARPCCLPDGPFVPAVLLQVVSLKPAIKRTRQE